MWKKLFVLLLSFDLLVIVAGAVGFAVLSQPHKQPSPPAQSVGQEAEIPLTIGQDAINTYLAYAVSESSELRKTVSYATVQLGTEWNLQFGFLVGGRVLPVSILVTPTIHSGNLDLRVQQAHMGGLPIPPAVLVSVLQHAPLPAWIVADRDTNTIDLNVTARPKSPYGVRFVSYDATTKQLSVILLVAPKAALPPQA
ncbi:DUF2140 family protein [Alicyclobacillus cycloheptanicus]|uniref:Uncharacterized protein YpmS n=1 Tax=Alicyclobacillus cycloheptanicus TaxID=1457 RepID=A0ABT9XKC9_9BACL|nr:DUF2140 family protein [Alicyclobacillus cycloheptanicus]MDQ0190748.1 uncharacterized protein YpmS [Alicyclobacillus cycloheptanicus]WDL99865.1 DUF2140 family protein [Alicyclobacillus cycloheptanicus]